MTRSALMNAGLAAAGEKTRTQVQSTLGQGLLLATAGIFALFALGFLGAAAAVALAPEVGLAPALLIVAGLYLALALVCLLVARAIKRRAARRKAEMDLLLAQAFSSGLLKTVSPALGLAGILLGFLSPRR